MQEQRIDVQVEKLLEVYVQENQALQHENKILKLKVQELLAEK